MSPKKPSPLFRSDPVVVHLEDPPDSGLAACCGEPFTSPLVVTQWAPRVLCTGCALRMPRFHGGKSRDRG